MKLSILGLKIMHGIRYAVATLAFLTGVLPAAAQSTAGWPTRPVRIIVPAAVGGPTDIVARMLANEIGQALGQSFWVENRPGAGHLLGTAAMASADADGYTLGVVTTPHVVNPWLRKKMPYESRDLQAVSWLTSSPLVLVVPAKLPAASVQELVRLAKVQPGKLNMASAGNATGPHLAGELFRAAAGIQVQHVPYRGGPDATTAMLRGDSHLYFDTPSSAMPNVTSGALRALAMTFAQRTDALPGVPTIAEAGYPGFEFDSWNGLVAPAKVASAIVAHLEQKSKEALQRPEIRRKLSDIGFVPVGGSSQSLAALIAADLAKWERVIKETGIVAE